MADEPSQQPSFVLQFEDKVYVTTGVQEIGHGSNGADGQRMLDEGRPVARAAALTGQGAETLLAGFGGANNVPPVQPASFDGFLAANNDPPVQT